TGRFDPEYQHVAARSVVAGLWRNARISLALHPGYGVERPALGSGVALRGQVVQSSVVRIGTRGSALALAQAGMVRARIAAAHGLAAEAIELKIIRTTGDQIQDRPLAEVGGKGLFTKEIEEALIAGTIDLAVHSAKDLPTVLPAGLLISAVLPREDPRDVFISRKAKALRDLPLGAKVGTASLRPQARVKRLRGELHGASLRGDAGRRVCQVAA